MRKDLLLQSFVEFFLSLCSSSSSCLWFFFLRICGWVVSLWWFSGLVSCLWGINKLSCALLDAGGYFARGFAVNRSCSRSRIVVVVAVSHFLREQAFFLLSVLRLGGRKKTVRVLRNFDACFWASSGCVTVLVVLLRVAFRDLVSLLGLQNSASSVFSTSCLLQLIVVLYFFSFRV